MKTQLWHCALVGAVTLTVALGSSATATAATAQPVSTTSTVVKQRPIERRSFSPFSGIFGFSHTSILENNPLVSSTLPGADDGPVSTVTPGTTNAKKQDSTTDASTDSTTIPTADSSSVTTGTGAAASSGSGSTTGSSNVQYISSSTTSYDFTTPAASTVDETKASQISGLKAVKDKHAKKSHLSSESNQSSSQKDKKKKKLPATGDTSTAWLIIPGLFSLLAAAGAVNKHTANK